jgi:hypothetical protein
MKGRRCASNEGTFVLMRQASYQGNRVGILLQQAITAILFPFVIFFCALYALLL